MTQSALPLSLKKTRRLTVNLGGYESFASEATVEVPVYNENSSLKDAYTEAALSADHLLDRVMEADLKEAAKLTDVRNSFVLTWLHDREN
jgi:hypothetical protein